MDDYKGRDVCNDYSSKLANHIKKKKDSETKYCGQSRNWSRAFGLSNSWKTVKKNYQVLE